MKKGVKNEMLLRLIQDLNLSSGVIPGYVLSEAAKETFLKFFNITQGAGTFYNTIHLAEASDCDMRSEF